MRMKRPYSVWTDRVETEVLRKSRWQSRRCSDGLFNRIQLPLMEWYHRWIIRKAASDCSMDEIVTMRTNPIRKILLCP